ncbi:MAG TPA: PHB depolymerase family esterase, partial [Mycobacterium sp.]
NVDDIGFLTGVVRDIGANVPIDPARVYAAGISNGGVMAFALACQTDLFAAVGVVSGTQLGGCNPPNPPSVIQIHGTSDPIIHFDGSPGFGFAGGQPIPAIDAFWRDTNHCGAPSDRVDGALTISTAGCADGRGVELVTVGKGGHSWPPFATSMLWDFFAAHPR